MTNRALLVVDMLSIEVLTSYELAEIAGISEGYDVGLDRTPVTA
jgi:hypothetical protein